MRFRSVLTLALLALAPFAGARSALAEKDIMGGGYVVQSFPMDDWGKTAGYGLGLDGSTIVRPDVDRPFALRTNMGFLYNFSRTADVPPANYSPPTNTLLDLETKNTSIFFGIGPEFGPSKGNVNPFIYGTVGAATYWTQSTLSGTAGGVPYRADYGDSRIAFVWTAGIGLRRKVAHGTMGELSVEYMSGPGHKYVIPDQVTTSGSTVYADRSSRDTNQIIVRIGTVLSAPGVEGD
jgi:hypothetical protein